MPSLCYNITVRSMDNEYKYYISIIKPIEKKYNRICIFYSIFKFKWLEEKKRVYDNLLINYYVMLQKNDKYTEKLEKQIKNSHQDI